MLNDEDVAAKDDGAFSRALVSVKQQVIAHPLYSTDLFSSLLTSAEREAIGQVEGLGDSVEIASIELFGEGGPSIPVTIPLPDKVKEFGVWSIQAAFDRIRSLYVEITGVRLWQ